MLGETLIKLRKKHGLSQQEVADTLEVTRQTISNWECEQAIPALDKAKMLADLYHVGLDDLFDENVTFVTKKNKEPSTILKSLVGCVCDIECGLLDAFENYEKLKILEVNDEWVKVEYTRTKTNSILKKESVIKYLELSSIKGFLIREEK